MKNKAFLISAVLGALILSAAVLFFKNAKPVESETFRVKEEYLVRPGNVILGKPDARVTVVEFFDPECEACRAMHPVTERLLREYEGQIRLVYRYTPLHEGSIYASSVLEAAKEVGKFNEALEILFEKQPEWGSHETPRADLIPGYLAGLGLSSQQLDRASVIAKFKPYIEREQADSAALMVQQTPTFFVNRRPLFEIGYEPLKAAIEQELAR